MPKMKTNRGAAKRFSRTGSGKFKHRQSHRSHILTKKVLSVNDSYVRHSQFMIMTKRQLPEWFLIYSEDLNNA